MKHQPTCQYCGKPAQLVRGDAIYKNRDDLHDMMFWRCAPCDAYVGCHRKGCTVIINNRKVISDGTVPLGILANSELRRWKSLAHSAFDWVWSSGRLSRHESYTWLSSVLGVKKDKCHIGMFDVAMCQRVVKIMEKIK